MLHVTCLISTGFHDVGVTQCSGRGGGVGRVSGLPASCIRDCPKTKGGEGERRREMTGSYHIIGHRVRLIRGGGGMGKRCNNDVMM